MRSGRLTQIKAVSGADGNSIDISWQNPDADVQSFVRIVRREGTSPVSPDNGTIIDEISAILFTADIQSASGELDKNEISPDLEQAFRSIGISLSQPSVGIINRSLKWIISDTEERYIIKKNNDGTSSVYKIGSSVTDDGLKSETVYYYALFPYSETEQGRTYITDRSNRVAAMSTGKYDMAGQMYNLLPRIYHRYDTSVSHKVAAADKLKGALRRFLEIPGSQLDQLYSFAKSSTDLQNINKADGALLPLLAQWIGWKTDYRLETDRQRNEIRAAPYVYQTIGLIPNIEAAVKRISNWESRTKEFFNNVFLSNSPERLNLWALKMESGKWAEEPDLCSLDYAYEGRPVAARDEDGKTTWLFYHAHKKRDWHGIQYNDAWNIWYKTRRDGEDWSPSKPVIDRAGIDKFPAADVHNNTLWLFWSVYDADTNAWHIEYRFYHQEKWSVVYCPDNYPTQNPFPDYLTERKKPLTTIDDAGVLWLIWLEKFGDKWSLITNKYDGSSWQTPQPIDLLKDRQIEDQFVFSFSGTIKRIYLFWSEMDKNSNWSLHFAYLNQKPGADWIEGPVLSIQGCSIREPAAIATEKEIDVYCSSNINGPWSAFRIALSADNNTWSADRLEAIKPGAFSQRDPLPIPLDNGLTLIFRSNQSISYYSNIYTATSTMDLRYSGSTSIDASNSAKLDLMKRKQFEDFQTYTYDTGKGNENKYSRDTVGMYLTLLETEDNMDLDRNKDIVQQLLNEIKPVQNRIVFIYDRIQPLLVSETYDGENDERKDHIPEWKWLHSVEVTSAATPKPYSDNDSVNCGTHPPDTKYKTVHTGLDRYIEED